MASDNDKPRIGEEIRKMEAEPLLPIDDCYVTALRFGGFASYHLSSRVSARGGWPNNSFTEAGSS